MFTISCPPKVVWLGREGENEFRTIEVEVSEWLREYPNGTISVVYHRPDDSIYMPAVTTSGNVTRWLITSTDTSFTGRGEAEFRIIDGDIIGKSVKMPTMVSDGINATTDDPDSAPADWTVEAGRLQNEIDDLDTRVTELEEHGGGGEGTGDHRQLTNRDAANQHPISAITGLQSALDGKQASGDYATSGELDALADIVDGKADAADIPSLAGYATEAYVQNYHDNTKQDVISDIASIRSGAALGATALQSVPNTYRTAAQQDIIDNGKQDKLIAGQNITIAADGKTISASGGGGVDNITLVTANLVGTTISNPSHSVTQLYTAAQTKAIVLKLSNPDDNLDISELSLDKCDSENLIFTFSNSSARVTVDDENTWTYEEVNYAEMSDIPQNVSELTNDSGYLTLATLPKYNGGVR